MFAKLTSFLKKTLTKNSKNQNELNNLKEQYLFFKTLIDNSSDFVIFVDFNDLSIIYANSIFFEKSGYSKDEIKQKKISDIYTYFKKENTLEYLKDELSKSDTFLIDDYLITKNFEHISVEHVISIKNLQNRKYFVIFSKDTTLMKQKERKILEQKEFLEMIFEKSPNLIFVKDYHGAYKFVNSAFCESFGINHDDIIGFDDSKLFEDLTEVKKFQTLDQNVLEAGEARFFPIVPAIIDSNNKETKYYQTMLITLNRDKSLSERLLLGIAHDITILKKTQDELEELNKDLESKVKLELEKNIKNEQILIQQSKMALIGELMNNISHHWRQPLNVISIGVDDIYDQFTSNSLSQEEFLSIYKLIQRSLIDLSETIDGFRTFFKSSNVREVFNILFDFEQLQSMTFEQLRAKNIKLKIDGSRLQNSELNAYKGELNQVVLNIINNSVDAITKNREIVGFYEGVINIILHEDSNYFFIDIIDNGGGIDEKIKDKIFEPYFTTKFQSTGTGLGLYMCKNIIEHHFFGKIGVQNIENGVKISISISKKHPS